MTREQILDIIGDDSVIVVDGMDDAFIGVLRGDPSVAVYSRQACITNLVAQGMSKKEAAEFFEYNIEYAYVGAGTPLFIEP